MGDAAITTEQASAFVEAALAGKPELMVYSDLTVTAQAALAALAAEGRTFERGGRLVQVVVRPGEIPTVRVLDPDSITNALHRVAQPVKPAQEKPGRPASTQPVTLPERCAKLMLAGATGGFPLLDGVTTAPLLTAAGEIIRHDGYHKPTKMWCASVPPLTVPAHPTKAEAAAALLVIRRRFATFAFADAARVQEAGAAVPLVDITKPPGADESGFLAALLTAVCRPSLDLAPGFKITAPAISGAGVGKGMLSRAVSAIAFGTAPAAFTPGHDRAELDKRLSAVLMDAAPAIMLDNVNGMALRSDALASALTERPARVRVLGRSEMVTLNPTAFITVTGNGLTLAEDLARRFVACDLDAKIEDPEARRFDPGFLTTVFADRPALLSAVLTIWRWGRQNAASLTHGKPLGSFETWAEWCRDPLLALGCTDPAERVAEAKAADPMRRRLAELFAAWWMHHKGAPLAAAELHEDVQRIADPRGRGRQAVASFVAKLAGTRLAGFELMAYESDGKWSATVYMLHQTARPASNEATI